MNHVLITISNLSAGYRDLRVLFDINLNAVSGEWILLIGPNGSGKSTLLKVVGGLLKPHLGSIVFDFSESESKCKKKDNIGFLKQTNNIFPALSVRENLEMASFYSNKCESAEYHDLLFSVFPDLEQNIDKRAGLLSGGMRQKLAIGMVLARRHRLILLDEPTAGLAPHAAVEILKKIEELKGKLSKKKCFTIIMVEHNYKYVIDSVTRVIGMREGKLVLDSDSPSKVLGNKKDMEHIFFG